MLPWCSPPPCLRARRGTIASNSIAIAAAVAGEVVAGQARLGSARLAARARILACARVDKAAIGKKKRPVLAKKLRKRQKRKEEEHSGWENGHSEATCTVRVAGERARSTHAVIDWRWAPGSL